MRLSRRDILYPTRGWIHKYWKSHNSEFLLASNWAKENYLRSTIIGLKHRSSDGSVKFQAYCVMNNHSHQLLGYTNGVDPLSRHMRISHSDFGRRFNRKMNRSGKVANERPRTVLIQETLESLMRTHMYIEANPIRAGICTFENLKNYKYSSFRFYAWGIKDEYTQHLEIPEWYLNLGNTPEERQAKYRSLFQLYLRQGQEKARPPGFMKFVIGDPIWSLNQIRRIRELARGARAGPS